MIVLVRFGPGWSGFGCISQFVLKVETYLRMSSIDFRVRDVGLDFPDAPKGKLPYIEHQGRVIADSNVIIEYLTAHFGDPLDGHLTQLDLARSHTLKRTLEEHIWWVMNRERWWAPENPYWHTVGMFQGMPQNEYEQFRDDSRRKCMEHGIGAYTAEEINARGAADMEAVSSFLGDQSFLLGDQPASVDATAYAFLFQILNAPYTSQLQVAAQSHPNLVAYVGRMYDRWFADDPLSAERQIEAI